MRNSSTSKSDKEERRSTDIKVMFSDILNEIKELKKENEEFKSERKKKVTEMRKELKNLDKKIEDRYGVQEEKIANTDNSKGKAIENLENQIQSLEEAEEHIQRRERKGNIIIKSTNFNETTREEKKPRSHNTTENRMH
ncbi:hypothetical protein ANN_14023 [Periplaneta americana]|uniref:Uncharacterized protein n=1 Tax=Periplaneta americana TaxID=6978 RepID=A0ABQ8SV55_PERAM|nr:hypothetical protein ANN_14023 [Periplaneta americana]